MTFTFPAAVDSGFQFPPVTLEQTINVVEPSGGDDTATIQYSLDNFVYTRLREGETYTISRSLTITADNRYLLGNDATLYGALADFDNVSTDFLASNAAFLQVKGQLVSPFAAISNIGIRDVRFQCEPGGGKKVDAIVLQNVSNVEVLGCEIFDFPAAIGVRVNSCTGYDVHHNIIRTFYDDTDWGGSVPNLSAIAVDGERTNSLYSTDGRIAFNRIRDIEAGPVFLAAHGNQTDGIQGGQGSEAAIVNNWIINVAEGIDWWGSLTTIESNYIRDCAHWCIALKHGFSHGIVADNILLEAEIGHIFIQPNGSAEAFKNSDGISITGNYCFTLTDNSGGGTTRACLRILSSTGSGGTAVCHNLHIEGNTFRPSGNGDYAIVYDNLGGQNNDILFNDVSPGLTGTTIVVAGTPRTYVPPDGVIRKLVGSKTFDPVALGAGTSESTTVTVPGAVFGDVCGASFSLDMQSMLLFAYVYAPDTVACVFYNWTGGTIDLGSGTLTAWAMR